MIAHTAFLVTARRLAPGVIAPTRQRRPAKAAEPRRRAWRRAAARRRDHRPGGRPSRPSDTATERRAGHRPRGARHVDAVAGHSLAASITSSRRWPARRRARPCACCSSPSASLTYARPSTSNSKTSGAYCTHSPSPVHRSWSTQTSRASHAVTIAAPVYQHRHGRGDVWNPWPDSECRNGPRSCDPRLCRATRRSHPPGRWDVARSEDAEREPHAGRREAHDLATQVAFLQEELALVRRKLTESPGTSGSWRSGSPRPRPSSPG